MQRLIERFPEEANHLREWFALLRNIADHGRRIIELARTVGFEPAATEAMRDPLSALVFSLWHASLLKTWWTSKFVSS